MSGPVRRQVKLFAQLRSAHLERAHQGEPATVFHRDRRFDFDETLLPGLDVRQLGALATGWALFRSAAEVVEVNEPLMAHGLVRTSVALAALDARRLLRRRDALVVSYAIENRDPFRSPAGTGLRTRLRRGVERRLAGHVSRHLDRLAFGTPDAEQLYATLLGPALRRTTTRAVPAVSAACDCLSGADTGSIGGEGLVVFLGALGARKGVPQLMAAWPEVARRRPGTRLALRGAGPLAAEVAAWTHTVPGAGLVEGASRQEVHALLRRADVLVLLSQPTPTWREQVGLPLVEALAHGCAVVTTSESGLAPWLAAHGHRVLSPAAAPEEVADAVLAALSEARPRASVLADLPAEDGRLAAERWLTGEPDHAA
jgi:glycosyltransferase involved in cell wall biosynthesis